MATDINTATVLLQFQTIKLKGRCIGTYIYMCCICHKSLIDVVVQTGSYSYDLIQLGMFLPHRVQRVNT